MTGKSTLAQSQSITIGHKHHFERIYQGLKKQLPVILMGAGIVDLTYSALLRSIIKNPYFPLLRQEYPQLATAGMTGLVAGAVEGSAFILLATYMLLRRSMTE